MLTLMRTFFFYIKITISQYKVKYKVDIRLNAIEQLAEPCSCRRIRWLISSLLHQTPAQETSTWKLCKISQLESPSNGQFKGETESYSTIFKGVSSKVFTNHTWISWVTFQSCECEDRVSLSRWEVPGTLDPVSLETRWSGAPMSL